jgi:hypothetical protein
MTIKGARAADMARAARLAAAISVDDKTGATALLVAAESDYDEPEYTSGDAAAGHWAKNGCHNEPPLI